MSKHFSAPPDQVDRMELWQVVAVLLPDPVEDRPVATTGPSLMPGLPNRPAISDSALIKARLAAAAAGQPEPLHLVGLRT